VIPPLDIFKLEPDGQLLWKGTAEDVKLDTEEN
jgi:hypothetical protein